jgi:hypothetical protein
MTSLGAKLTTSPCHLVLIGSVADILTAQIDAAFFVSFTCVCSMHASFVFPESLSSQA